VQVTWYDEAHLPGLTDLVQAVAGTGGAVGWLTVPSDEAVASWLSGLLAAGARLAVATEDGRVLACAALVRRPAGVHHGLADVTKVMTHPAGRRRGAGRAVTAWVVEAARADGVELLALGVRGNNHGAQRLYAGLGFVVTGRRPDALSVGDERFDEVLMHLDLRSGPQGLVRHGSRAEGPGRT
jgi:ribosomal protein S18 acetylase RimI-like enzyme